MGMCGERLIASTHKQKQLKSEFNQMISLFWMILAKGIFILLIKSIASQPE